MSTVCVQSWSAATGWTYASCGADELPDTRQELLAEARKSFPGRPLRLVRDAGDGQLTVVNRACVAGGCGCTDANCPGRVKGKPRGGKPDPAHRVVQESIDEGQGDEDKDTGHWSEGDPMHDGSQAAAPGGNDGGITDEEVHALVQGLLHHIRRSRKCLDVRRALSAPTLASRTACRVLAGELVRPAARQAASASRKRWFATHGLP